MGGEGETRRQRKKKTKFCKGNKKREKGKAKRESEFKKEKIYRVRKEVNKTYGRNNTEKQ